MTKTAQINTPRPGPAGPLEKFEALAMPCLSQLYYTALRLTRNRLDAEDLVQETYLKAWRFFHQFALGTNFGGWISRILLTNFINRYRSKKREPLWVNIEGLSGIIPHHEARDVERAPDSGVCENYGELFDDTITAALDRVPEHYRMIVLLSDVSDLSYKEIAKIVKCPIGTVMSRLSRGRKMLARYLSSYAYGNGYVRDVKPGIVKTQGAAMIC